MASSCAHTDAAAHAGAIRCAALAGAGLVTGSLLLMLLMLLGPLAPAASARAAASAETIAGGTAMPGEPTGPETGTEGAATGNGPSEAQTGESGGGETTTSVTASPEPSTVLTAGALTLRTRSAAIRGRVLHLSGAAPAGEAGQTVALERYVSAQAAWVEVAHARVEETGAVKVRWRPRVAGQVSLRATLLPSAEASSQRGRRRLAGAAAAIGTEPAQPGSGTVTVYRPALATFYGPGLYGRKTACGQVLTKGLIGVANRSLPCGTMVDISYAGRLLSVPVVDRGPYSQAQWDLTSGAAEALGFTSTAQIGTLVVGGPLDTPTLPTAPGATPEAAVTGGAAAAA